MQTAPAAANFAVSLPDDGYAWWYIDATSDDGRHGLTVIAFVGSVFSPYYAHARRRGPAAPYAHAALNVVLYGGSESRWAMTERPREALTLASDRYALGPNVLRWDKGRLLAHIDERGAPLPRRVQGEIAITPTPLIDASFNLDAGGLHQWRPLAPRARITVDFATPSVHWSGRAYVDSNLGLRPLERDFVGWDWSRSIGSDDTHVLYDVTPLTGAARQLALHIGQDGTIAALAPPPRVALPTTRVWRVPRATQSDSGRAELRQTLEDTPFYARSRVATQIGERAVDTLHESLSLARFRKRWVQALLAFRMLRRRR